MNRMVYKKKKKRKPLRKIFLLVFISTIAFLIYKLPLNINTNIIAQTVSQNGFTESSLSPEKSIAGQTLSKDTDGYTTTFTSLNEEMPKVYKEYKQNQDSSWAYNSYWGGTMAENGCGITSLSIIASGYGSAVTPENLRTKYYPHLDTTEIPKALKNLGIKASDFYFNNEYVSKKYITEWLKSNRPVLICVDNTKENIWTSASHYMVLLDVDENGLFYISNPNGIDGTKNASGWYSANEIMPYIVKALFIESY